MDRKTFEQYVSKELIELLQLNKNQIKAWVDTIIACWLALSGTNSNEAKTIYIRQAKNWHLFGSSIWPVEQKFKPKKLLMCINKEGLFVLNQQTMVKNLTPHLESHFDISFSKKS